ncbi:MAG: hypothetical protein GX606_04625 [Elusimicrobia bacterium]|nr:hypothetical protein [Elusimicrobiota bacterium]
MVKVERKGFLRILIGGIVFLMLASVFSGCASFRKKFVRKKKVKSTVEEFIPVLEPVEYARIEKTPAQAYQDHYTMVSAYFKDLDRALLDPQGADKQAKYFLAQIAAHVRGMAGLLLGELQAELLQIAGQIDAVAGAYDKPVSLRRYDIVRLDVKRIQRDIRGKFRPKMVLEGILPQP